MSSFSLTKSVPSSFLCHKTSFCVTKSAKSRFFSSISAPSRFISPESAPTKICFLEKVRRKGMLEHFLGKNFMSADAKVTRVAHGDSGDKDSAPRGNRATKFVGDYQ